MDTGIAGKILYEIGKIGLTDYDFAEVASIILSFTSLHDVELRSVLVNGLVEVYNITE